LAQYPYSTNRGNKLKKQRVFLLPTRI